MLFVIIFVSRRQLSGPLSSRYVSPCCLAVVFALAHCTHMRTDRCHTLRSREGYAEGSKGSAATEAYRARFRLIAQWVALLLFFLMIIYLFIFFQIDVRRTRLKFFESTRESPDESDWSVTAGLNERAHFSAYLNSLSLSPSARVRIRHTLDPRYLWQSVSRLPRCVLSPSCSNLLGRSRATTDRNETKKPWLRTSKFALGARQTLVRNNMLWHAEEQFEYIFFLDNWVFI